MSSSSQARLQRIQDLLSRLTSIRAFVVSGRAEKLFELECYLRTLRKLCSLNRKIVHHGPQGGSLFRPRFNPSNLGSGSYFTLLDRSGLADDMDLYMNCQVKGESEAFHSPDIILAWSAKTEIFSIYECKMYSSDLGIGVYREFIGYLTELGLRRSRWRAQVRRFAPDASPRIYTTAFALPRHRRIAEAYEFDVEDNLP